MIERGIVSEDIADVISSEIHRFQMQPKSSQGGIPCDYADHLPYLRERKMMRRLAEEREYSLPESHE